MKISAKPRPRRRRARAADAAAVLARAAVGLRTIRDRHKARTVARRLNALNDYHLRDLGVHRGHVAARRLDIAWVGEGDAEH